MTVLAVTLPLARSTPLHLSRRDMSTHAGDDLALQLSIVADDTPGAGPVNLAGASVQLLLWHVPERWDYGWYWGAPGRDVFHTATGTVTDAPGGKVSIAVPLEHDHGWPKRMGYTCRIEFGESTRTTLGWGALHMPRAYA